MPPPPYCDLGKAARDLFSKGYNYGFFKFEGKTKTSSGVCFTAKGNQSSDTGKFTGDIETKYKWSDYGITFTEKWTPEYVLNTEVSIEDQLIKGSKLTFDTSFAPQTGKKSGKIKTGYKQDYVNVNCAVDFDFAGPTIHGAFVLGYSGFLAGYHMSFDTSKSKLTKNNFAFGYSEGDFTLHTCVNDASEFEASIHQKVSDNIEAGVNLSWMTGSIASRFAVGGKYTLDKDSSISAKFNNLSQVGFGYSQNLRDGVKLTLYTLIEGKNINQGCHKLGLGLEFEA